MALKRRRLYVKLNEEQEATIQKAADIVIATRQTGTRSDIYRGWILEKAKRVNESSQPGPVTDATGMPYSLEAED